MDEKKYYGILLGNSCNIKRIKNWDVHSKCNFASPQLSWQHPAIDYFPIPAQPKVCYSITHLITCIRPRLLTVYRYYWLEILFKILSDKCFKDFNFCNKKKNQIDFYKTENYTLAIRFLMMYNETNMSVLSWYRCSMRITEKTVVGIPCEFILIRTWNICDDFVHGKYSMLAA